MERNGRLEKAKMLTKHGRKRGGLNTAKITPEDARSRTLRLPTRPRSSQRPPSARAVLRVCGICIVRWCGIVMSPFLMLETLNAPNSVCKTETHRCTIICTGSTWATPCIWDYACKCGSVSCRAADVGNVYSERGAEAGSFEPVRAGRRMVLSKESDLVKSKSTGWKSTCPFT